MKVLKRWYVHILKGSLEGDSADNPLGPFTVDAVKRMREKTEGRIGEFLVRAREVLETAAGEKAQAPLDAAYVDAITTASLGDEVTSGAYTSRAISRELSAADALLE